MTTTTAPTLRAVRWQAPGPDGIAHAYPIAHPGMGPLCIGGPPFTHERFAYPEIARCSGCLAIDSRPLLRRMGRV